MRGDGAGVVGDGGLWVAGPADGVARAPGTPRNGGVVKRRLRHTLDVHAGGAIRCGAFLAPLLPQYAP